MTGKAALLAIVFLAALVALPVERAAAGCAAESFVKSAAIAMGDAARSKSAAAFSNVASRYGDLHGTALFALGPHRKSLKKSQEVEYVSLARAFIGRFMLKHAKRFTGHGLDIISCTGNRPMVVKVKLKSCQNVIFKIQRTGGGYRVQDLNVSSIWLAQQLRSTFTGVIRRNNGDLGALMAFLRG